MIKLHQGKPQLEIQDLAISKCIVFGIHARNLQAQNTVTKIQARKIQPPASAVQTQAWITAHFDAISATLTAREQLIVALRICSQAHFDAVFG